MSTTINREMPRARAGVIDANAVGDLLRSLEVVVFILAVCVAIALFAAAEWMARYWLTPQELPLAAVIDALRATALVVAARFCEGFYRGALLGLERHVFYNVAFASLSTLRYGGAALIVTVIPSIEAFFVWQACVSVITVAIFAAAAHTMRPRTIRRVRFSASALHSIVRFAGGLSLATLIALLFTQIDKIIVSRIVDLESFDLYMLAFALAGIFTMVTVPISSSFFPRFTAVNAEHNHAAEH